MKGLTEIEEAALEALLSSSLDEIDVLREQAKLATVKRRDLSGVGVFIEFNVDDESPIMSKREPFHISGIEAVVDGLEGGIGFLVFINDGRLDMLEGHTYGEDWPSKIENFTIENPGNTS